MNTFTISFIRLTPLLLSFSTNKGYPTGLFLRLLQYTFGPRLVIQNFSRALLWTSVSLAGPPFHDLE